MATYRNINTQKYIETKIDDHNMINLQTNKQADKHTKKNRKREQQQKQTM